MTGFSFEEVMEGTLRKEGQTRARHFKFVFDVEVPELREFFRGVAIGPAVGRVDIEGMASGASAEGSLELSPYVERRIRYVFEFTGDDGERYRFDGEKHIDWRRAAVTWTTLPGTLFDAAGTPVALALLRLSFRHHLRGLLTSFRLRRHAVGAARA